MRPQKWTELKTEKFNKYNIDIISEHFQNFEILKITQLMYAPICE